MATVHAHIDATPQTVFAVLADGWHYSNWVVGTSNVRAVQADLPMVGSKLSRQRPLADGDAGRDDG